MEWEPKFRGIREETNTWYYGFYTECVKLGGGVHSCITNKNLDLFFVVPESVGMYLHNKDCRGTNEYEGDIVKTDTGAIGLLGISTQNFHCTVDWTKPLTEPYTSREVIGNIRQNPELLKP